jgi:hypothetical protein
MREEEGYSAWPTEDRNRKSRRLGQFFCFRKQTKTHILLRLGRRTTTTLVVAVCVPQQLPARSWEDLAILCYRSRHSLRCSSAQIALRFSVALSRPWQVIFHTLSASVSLSSTVTVSPQRFLHMCSIDFLCGLDCNKNCCCFEILCCNLLLLFQCTVL